jgi:hypothetical protein
MTKLLVESSRRVFMPDSDPVVDLPERDIVAEAPSDLDRLLVVVTSAEAKRQRVRREAAVRRAPKSIRILCASRMVAEPTSTITALGFIEMQQLPGDHRLHFIDCGTDLSELLIQ